MQSRRLQLIARPLWRFIPIADRRVAMRLHRYRTLAAMVAMADRFTVAELAQYSGVKETTVRTILKREQHRVKEIGRDEVRGRGGVSKVYALLPGERDKALQELRALEEAASAGESGSTSPGGVTGEGVPRPLLVALDVLLFRIPRSSTDDWPELIHLASVSMAHAARRSGLKQPLPGTRAWAHVAAADYLLELAKAEHAVLEDPTAQAGFVALADRLGAVVEEIGASGELELAEAVSARFEGAHPTELQGEAAPAPLAITALTLITPPMTAYRRDGELIMEFDLPAVRGPIEVRFDRNSLIVEAERACAVPEGSVLLVSDRQAGRYRRQLFVDDGFDVNRLTCTYSMGVLTLSIPVAEKALGHSMFDVTTPATYSARHADSLLVDVGG
ncbi:Hsp20/alpha crystallin family protein [Streptomyces kaniharaensis]|uniref:Hsp20/alpha crystallin family protein n=1 Tax=Streptomyces kaniharaensis TaxID=212423 RepID=A0A6N7L4Q6_9ACTN|nr:Hsp20/alpha crystallin family protein [Streptomyces kaniharaensis]MQS17638.1 Hsp20/alpha crystallin family protein [Streptomyces kaniharaensis]